MAKRTKRRSDVASVAGRPYWQEAEARVVVEAWRRSGDSMRRFSAGFGIHPARLARWVHRLEGGEASAPISFVPIRLGPGRPEVRDRAASAIVLRHEGGLRVEVAVGFDEPTLQRVLAVLEESSSW